MCMEDVRLGRELAPQARAVAVTAGTPLVVLGPDPQRTRVIISGDGVGTVFVGFDGLAPTATQGVCLPPQDPRETFRVEEWGRLVEGPITVAVAAGTVSVSVATASLEKR
jgi:hypothetical protein